MFTTALLYTDKTDCQSETPVESRYIEYNITIMEGSARGEVVVS